MNPFQVYYTKTNVNPEGIGDDYLAYNKPYGVMSWLQDTDPVGDYFLILDADKIFHRCGLLSVEHVHNMLATRVSLDP